MASDVGSGVRMTTESPSVDALWLDALQRICVRTAHEFKGVLNGVSVNLEVVRSRAERPDAPASAVAPYALSATSQLASVIAMTEALLSLARPAREPVDVGAILRRLDVLLAATARADGHMLELGQEIDDVGMTSATGNAARMVLASSLIAALDASGDIVCHARSDESVLVVRIDCRHGATPALDADVIAAAAEHSIGLVVESSGISISLPR